MVLSVVVGNKMENLKKRSILENMTELLWEGGRSVTESSAMCDQGWLGTAGGRWDAFPQTNTEQAGTNSWASASMVGHQNGAGWWGYGWFGMMGQVTHCKAIEWMELGTNRPLAGHLPESGWARCASVSQEMAATTQDAGRMVSEIGTKSEDTNDGRKCLDWYFLNLDNKWRWNCSVQRKVTIWPDVNVIFFFLHVFVVSLKYFIKVFSSPVVAILPLSLFSLGLPSPTHSQ